VYIICDKVMKVRMLHYLLKRGNKMNFLRNLFSAKKPRVTDSVKKSTVSNSTNKPRVQAALKRLV